MTKKVKVQRLAKKEEGSYLKKIFFFSLISLIIVIAFFMVGISLLGRFADFLGILFEGDNSDTAEIIELTPPIINDLPSATYSASIDISGFSSDGEKIEIFLKDTKVGEADIVDNQFLFENLKLISGENALKVKAVDGDSSSNFSSVFTVVFDDIVPKLEVETPFEDQSFSGNNRVHVMGRTDPDAQVFVNSFLASVDFEGNFDVFVPLNEGENLLEVKAVDTAGNFKLKSVKVSFKK